MVGRRSYAFILFHGCECDAPKAYVGLFGDSAVAVLDAATNKLVKTIPVPAGPHGLVMTPDGKYVFASSYGDSSVSVIDTDTGGVIARIDVSTAPCGLAITPNGNRVLVAGYGTNKVVAIDTSTRKILWKTTVPRPHNLGITPDGRTAYAASQQEGRLGLVIIDVRTGSQRGAVPLNHMPRALAVSPEASCANAVGTVIVKAASKATTIPTSDLFTATNTLAKSGWAYEGFPSYPCGQHAQK